MPNNYYGSSFCFSGVKLYDLLSGLKPKEDNQKTKFNVTRSNPLEGARRALRRKDFNPASQISVRFADDFGQAEGAIDEGGPMRELFRLLLLEMKDSAAFSGDDKSKFIVLDSSCKCKLKHCL